MVSNVTAFPWDHGIESVSRAELLALRRVRSIARRYVDLEALIQALSELIGSPLSIRFNGVRIVDDANIGFENIALHFSDASSPGPDRAIFLEVEPSLALHIVAPVLNVPAPQIVDDKLALSDKVAGALGAVLCAALRRSSSMLQLNQTAPLRLIGAGRLGHIAETSRGHDRFIRASFTVRFANETFSALVMIREPSSFPLHPDGIPAWNRQALESLGEISLSVCIVACADVATAVDFGTLRPGDAWIPSQWPIRFDKPKDKPNAKAELVGPVLLIPADGEIAFKAQLDTGGRTVLIGDAQILRWTPDQFGAHSSRRDIHNMHDDTDANAEDQKGSDPLTDSLGDAPVVVRVELGEVRMRAREWAALRKGDVLATGQQIGENVTLRAGGVTVARGELVNIEGEIGVRILNVEARS